MKCYLVVLGTIVLSLIHRLEGHIAAFDEKTCPILLPRNFTQNHLLTQLTTPCRYNKKHTPLDPAHSTPLKVTARIHVYHLKSGSEANAEFKVQLLLQLHWKDPRLRYRELAPHYHELIGERNFIQSIWTPHIYLTNERDSLVLGLFRRDMLVSILPDGDLLFSTRLKTTIFCWVQLGKFPFDQQKCHLVMDSWRYNASELMLEWDPNPVTIPPSKPYLTEYSLMDTVTQVQDQFAEPSAVADTNTTYTYMYSSLTLTFILNRQYGFYLMDFYAPSILLVCISWVSFWMAPDAVPGRTILGASSLLTFFQLGIETGSALPNVSYIRSNDVWFFACTVFIFLSLAEFAFVNTIWRYGDQKVQLKKPTSKYILKSSVHPHLHHHNQERRKSLSCQTTPEMRKTLDKQKNKMQSELEKSISTLDLALQTKDSLPLQNLKSHEDDDMGICLTVPTDRTRDSSPRRAPSESLLNSSFDRNTNYGAIRRAPSDCILTSRKHLTHKTPSESLLSSDSAEIADSAMRKAPSESALTDPSRDVTSNSIRNRLPPRIQTVPPYSEFDVHDSDAQSETSFRENQSEMTFHESDPSEMRFHQADPSEMRFHQADPSEMRFYQADQSQMRFQQSNQSEMSMQDIAIWVDDKSKVVFPLAFTLFNATYWGVLYQS